MRCIGGDMDMLDVITYIIGWAVLCILLYFCLLGLATFIVTSKSFDKWLDTMIKKELREYE